MLQEHSFQLFFLSFTHLKLYCNRHVDSRVLFFSSLRLLESSIEEKNCFFNIEISFMKAKERRKKLREKESKQKLCWRKRQEVEVMWSRSLLFLHVNTRGLKTSLKHQSTATSSAGNWKKLFASFFCYSHFKLPHDEARLAEISFEFRVVVIGKFFIKSVIEVVQCEIYLSSKELWKTPIETRTSLWARRKTKSKKIISEWKNTRILVQTTKEFYFCSSGWGKVFTLTSRVEPNSKSDKLKCCAVIWVFWSDKLSPHYSWKKNISDISTLWPEKTWKNHLDEEKKLFIVISVFPSDYKWWLLENFSLCVLKLAEKGERGKKRREIDIYHKN